MKNKYYNIRYAARIIGGIASIFFFYVAFKGGLIEVMKGVGGDKVQFFPFLALAVAGYMISYVQERRGGYFMLIGGVTLFLFFIIHSPGFDWAQACIFGFPFMLPGAALVYCNQKGLNQE